MITRLAEGPLHTLFGTFRELLYDDEHRERIALVMGQVEAGADVLCRVHSHGLGAHVFNRGSSCGPQRWRGVSAQRERDM